MPYSFKVIIAAGAITVGTTFSSILLTQYFLNCCNCGSNYITQ